VPPELFVGEYSSLVGRACSISPISAVRVCVPMGEKALQVSGSSPLYTPISHDIVIRFRLKQETRAIRNPALLTPTLHTVK